MPADAPLARWREIAPSRQAEFVARGFRPSLFFAHGWRCLPKCGPDGYKLAQRMCGAADPDAQWEIVLYAQSPQLDEFPPGLFFDDDLVWHRQQFGLPGQLATANLVLDGATLHSMAHVADVVQRIGRRREHKTRIEKLFRGWTPMLLNAVLDFAVERGVATVRTPTSGLARRHTDPARWQGAELFERIYDRSVLAHYAATRDGDWWAIDVAANRDRIVAGEARASAPADADAKVICICHDVERGLGHVDVEPAFAAEADRTSAASLAAMLDAERAAGVAATYDLVGTLFGEERARIEAGGHAVAFHSYDHVIDEQGGGDQLRRCREVDYRIKGYRPPRSLATEDTATENLLLHNFEWLATSRYTLRCELPRMRRRLVEIPITFDDFELHQPGWTWEAWEQRAFDEIARRPFVAFGLHDCYAKYWLPHYPRFLARLQALGTLRTLDEVAAAVTLRHAA